MLVFDAVAHLAQNSVARARRREQFLPRQRAVVRAHLDRRARFPQPFDPRLGDASRDVDILRALDPLTFSRRTAAATRANGRSDIPV